MVLLVVGCAKAPTVMRQGVEMPAEEAAKLDYTEAERLFQRKQYVPAAKIYQGIATDLGMTSYADNALYRLGQIEKIRNKPAAAEAIFQSIIVRYPLGDAANDAKEELAKSAYARKDFARAAELYGAIDWSKIAPSRRASLDRTVREVFDASGARREKLRYLLAIYDLSPSSAQDLPRQAEIVELLDRSLNREELEQLVESRGDKFPADYATYKLAKLAYHTGDVSGARSWVSRYLNRFRDREYTREAVVFSDALTRRETVDTAAIGLLLPMTGSNRAFGTQVLRGAALAIELFGSTTSAKPSVSLYIENCGDEPEEAVAALEKLVSERHVMAVIGPLSSRQTQAAALAAVNYGLPLISFSAAEGITSIGPNVFRYGLTKSIQAEALAAVVRDTLRIQRTAILYPESSYGTEFMNLFWEAYERRGGEIRGAEGYAPDATDFGLPLKRLTGRVPIEQRRSEICSAEESARRQNMPELRLPACYESDKVPAIVDFEGLFVADNFEKAVQAAPALAYYDIRGVQLLGTNLWNTDEIFQGGDKGSYLQGAVFVDSFFKNKKDPALSRFMEKFYAVYGAEPGIFEVEAYDTVSMLLSILEKNHPSNREELGRALAGMRDFPGAAGAVSVTEQREFVKSLSVLTIDEGRIVELN